MFEIGFEILDQRINARMIKKRKEPMQKLRRRAIFFTHGRNWSTAFQRELVVHGVRLPGNGLPPRRSRIIARSFSTPRQNPDCEWRHRKWEHEAKPSRHPSQPPEGPSPTVGKTREAQGG
ncbi:hypothetical protein [Methylobacterium komagatae]